MFSNDKNIERIADFVEEAKRWVTIRKEYAKLDIIDKIVQVCTSLALTLIFVLLIVMILIYLSFAVAHALGNAIDSTPIAYLIVSAFYLVLLIIIYCNRHNWIERPLVRFLVNVLLSDDNIDEHNN